MNQKWNPDLIQFNGKLFTNRNLVSNIYELVKFNIQ